MESIAVAAWALVTRGGSDLLLVSDDGRTWYTPGAGFAFDLIQADSITDLRVPHRPSAGLFLPQLPVVDQSG